MVIIIALLILQSLILAIYHGASQEYYHFYLFLDLLLLLTKFTNKLTTLLLILSVCLHFEIFNPQQLDTAYFITMRMVVSSFILQKKERIVFITITLLYIFIRLSIYNKPTIYIAIVTIIAITIYSFLMDTRQQKHTIEMDLHKLYAFFQDALPLSLCIIQQDSTNQSHLAIKFQTQQFTIEYGQLNPETIPQITSKSNLETLAAFLKRPKPSENIPYECLHRRKLEQCTLEIADKNLQEAFPIDIEIIEIIWEYQPANLIIFESQNQKFLKSQVQQLQIQDIYKDELLASVSHDFKTPINGIMSIVQYLEEISTDENQLYHLRIIIKNASLLLFMISDILDFARIQKNQLRLCNSTFYVQNIVSEIIELLSLQSHQKGIEISSKFNLKSGLMYSDPNRIKQILLNLLSNSLKFTERGQIQVLVDQENFDDRLNPLTNKVITITVTDTGVGIPDNVKPKLFKMFGTFDFKNGMNRNGIGLGLHFCKKLVCLLGPTDEIKLESTVGQGSKFSFQIYLNNEQKNSPPIGQNGNGGSSSEYEYVSVQGPNFQKNRPNYIMSSQILIFNKPLDQLKQNLKQMNKKTFTSLELPARQPVLPMSALDFHHQKKTNSRVIKGKNPGDLLIMEDPENSKRHNINKLINNESTFGSQFKEIRKLSIGSIICNSPPQNQYELPEEQMNKLFPTDVDILVVDDSAVNVFAFKLILRRYQQIHIDEAFNGEQALLKIQQKTRQKEYYSFIFMDLTMPIMNGYTAVETLRYMESTQKLRKNNLIALTGYDDSKEKERCRQCGFDAFMTKPIKLSDIIQVVQEIQNKS